MNLLDYTGNGKGLFHEEGEKGQGMKDERGSFNFEIEKANIELALRFAWREGRLANTDYVVLLRRAREARTLEELREIVGDLARILRSRMREGPQRGPGNEGFSARKLFGKGVHL